MDDALVDWLLDSDPALRWQVERDLLHRPEEVWATTRARVATEGFGARLLALQDPDGQWAGGAFFPGDFTFEDQQNTEGQPWTATTWSLNALREWGLPASLLAGTAEKLAANSRWEYDNLPYWGGEVDCCINAFTLANGVWLGADVTELADWFPAHQMDDGGWNCEWVDGSKRSSVHSTINSLNGLLDYELATGGNDTLRGARHKAEQYLLRRRLLYTLSTGEYFGKFVPLFAYPFRSAYTALRALDYFYRAAQYEGRAPHAEFAEAIEIVRSARNDDGTWTQQYRFPGQAWFEVDVPPGEPSKWLTFYAQRVLNWVDEP